MRKAQKVTLTVTGLMMLAGLIAYVYQYKEGLIVTNMAQFLFLGALRFRSGLFRG